MQLTEVKQKLQIRILKKVSAVYNSVMRPAPRSIPVGPGPINEIASQARKPTDISDHLVTLFVEAAEMQPSLIVELGVRSGESSFALSRAAKLFGSRLVSVDLEDCSPACVAAGQAFVQSDDIRFAVEFSGWCERQGIVPSVDVLFIDTSHEFGHTVAEIENWFPHLSPHCKVLFHDTNMGAIYFRKDRTMGVGWENNRGVIAAIEQYFGCRFDERRDFSYFAKGWIIRHQANCNGLTVLERVCTQPTDSTYDQGKKLNPIESVAV